MCDWFDNWPSDWLLGCLNGWLVGRSVGCLVNWQAKLVWFDLGGNWV